MPVLRDIPISLTPEQIIADRAQRRPRPELMQLAEAAIALGQTLWQPVAVFERLAVHVVHAEQVQLASPSGANAVFHVGPKAHLLSKAHQVLIGVGTIGPALEKQVHQLQAEGQVLQSYLLDSAGVVALGAVGEALRCLAEEAAAEMGWGVSAALSPGSLVGWPLTGQREVCALLPLDKIDVRLNSHYVLIPYKSFSVVIGLGPGYETAKVGSVCKYCALKKTCWRRREEPS